MNIKEARKILLKDPQFRAEYYNKDLAFEIAKIIVEARILKRITQSKLAELIGTKQPSIARIERGENLPSLGILVKIAKAFKTNLLPPQFGFMSKTAKISYKTVSAQYIKREVPPQKQNRNTVETSSYWFQAI